MYDGCILPVPGTEYEYPHILATMTCTWSSQGTSTPVGM